MNTTKKRKNNPSCVITVSPSSSRTIIIDHVEHDNINVWNTSSTVSDKVIQSLLCPITHMLMVDPVLAEDGHTYERSSIEEWLSINPTSPLIPNKRLKTSNLAALRSLQETVKALVETGAVNDTLTESWKEKRKELNLVKARELYNEGSTLDAAKLGLPEAQGKISEWYFFGSYAIKKDLRRSLEWAKKAAEGGDVRSQFRLGYFYSKGIPGTISIDNLQAISWYEKASNQGCGASMYSLGVTYENGGCVLDQNYLQKSAFWYEKGASKDHAGCLVKIGLLTYDGKGVTKCHKTARECFAKAVDVTNKSSTKQELLKSNFWLGKMMVKGEGGSKDFLGGITLIEWSASNGLSKATECLKIMVEVLD